MSELKPSDPTWELLKLLFKPHPWHGVSIGADAPGVVTVFVEIVPTDTVKYEIDKPSGHLKVDRPQKYSNVCPTLYGFVPQTFCGDRVAALSQERTGTTTVRGDGDPLDICVLSEKTFSHGDVLLQAVPIGGLRLIDHEEADDKIVAVLKGDFAFGHFQDISEVPEAQIERLKHYFLTYKRPPLPEDTGSAAEVAITHVYGRQEARQVIERSREDYQALFPDLRDRLLASLRQGVG
ncbi:MAG TPA: inorganic pyrophosphatase [Thermoanaerobaculia bacterium]|jgi:inorganic pyrophosphatase|nr:inorganic pyrophosphatase [Thermoanaerobaculia bacterium]